MPRMRRSTTTASRRTTSTPSNAHLDQLTTEVLRLRCDQLKLSATRSRQALLARLRSAPRQAAVVTNLPEDAEPEDAEPEDAEPEPTAPVNDTTATTSADREPSTGGFSSEQFETLQSLIASSLRDVTVPQLTPVTVPPEPEVSSTSTLFPTHLPAKMISSIRNGEYIDFNSLLPENVDGHDEHLKISFDSLGSGFSIPVSLSQPVVPTQTTTSRLYRTLAQCLQHFCSGCSPFFPVQGV